MVRLKVNSTSADKTESTKRKSPEEGESSATSSVRMDRDRERARRLGSSMVYLE